MISTKLYHTEYEVFDSRKVCEIAIHCLSKIGDELYLEASEDGLALRTVNSSRSAFGCFLFNESFFHEFNVDNGGKPNEDDEIERFKVSMKSCLGVFKSLHTIEKSVDTCKLEYDAEHCRIVFKLFCKHGIVKTHNLTFQESESLQAVFSKDLCPNLIIASARVLIDTAANFPNSCDEVTFCCTPESLTIKNYIEDEPDPSKIVHTEMRLHPGEFDNYRIGVDADVTFCLKEARAILAFSDFAAQPVNIHFAAPGKPIVFSLDGDSLYTADFVLATLMEHSNASQESQAIEGAVERASNMPKQRPTKSKKGTNSLKTSKSTKMAYEESEIQVEVSCAGDDLNDVDLRSLSTPPYHAHNKTKKALSRSTELHANDDDDFFSESFPYKVPRKCDINRSSGSCWTYVHKAWLSHEGYDNKENSAYCSIYLHLDFPSRTEERLILLDMLQEKKKQQRKNLQAHSSYGDDHHVHAGLCGVSTNTSMVSGDVSLPFVGNSATHQEEVPKTYSDVYDDVLPSTPPNKKFKSIFFGTVTAPEEIRKRRKLHETVLAEDTDDET